MVTAPIDEGDGGAHGASLGELIEGLAERSLSYLVDIHYNSFQPGKFIVPVTPYVTLEGKARDGCQS